jgi:quinol-cytochrome oxidoreductase complex cytochrome b subunit
MVVSMVILLILPWTTNNGFDINDPQFKPFFEVLYMYFVFTMLMLGWLGGQAVTDLVIQLGQFFTVCYFGYVVVITWLLSEMSLRFAI